MRRRSRERLYLTRASTNSAKAPPPTHLVAHLHRVGHRPILWSEVGPLDLERPPSSVHLMLLDST